LNKQYKTGIAREHSYRPALKDLLQDLLPKMVVTNEPAHFECGAPDYIISRERDHLPVFFVEAKDVNDNEHLHSIIYNCQCAYQTFAEPKQYKDSDVLYSVNNNQLTVGTFLKILKYAISIAEIIKPEDKRVANAVASILALQSLYHQFCNSSETELTNHTLHVATDFLASNVKDSLTDVNEKRSVAVSALMVNLTIDFLVKDKQ